MRQGQSELQENVARSGAAPSLKGLLAGALIVTALVLWLFPALDPLGRVQTSIQVSCRIPTEYEQLHIVVREQAGRLIGECLYLGARGSYVREARR